MMFQSFSFTTPCTPEYCEVLLALEQKHAAFQLARALAAHPGSLRSPFGRASRRFLPGRLCTPRRRDTVLAFIQADVHGRGWLDPNEAPSARPGGGGSSTSKRLAGALGGGIDESERTWVSTFRCEFVHFPAWF